MTHSNKNWLTMRCLFKNLTRRQGWISHYKLICALPYLQ